MKKGEQRRTHHLESAALVPHRQTGTSKLGTLPPSIQGAQAGASEGLWSGAWGKLIFYSNTLSPQPWDFLCPTDSLLAVLIHQQAPPRLSAPDKGTEQKKRLPKSQGTSTFHEVSGTGAPQPLCCPSKLHSGSL